MLNLSDNLNIWTVNQCEIDSGVEPKPIKYNTFDQTKYLYKSVEESHRPGAITERQIKYYKMFNSKFLNYQHVQFNYSF